MKNSIKNTALLILTVIFTASFATIKNDKKEIKTETSTISWKGYKVTGSHEGTIDLKSGVLIFENGKLSGGEFLMDMTTINTTDLEGDYKNKLDGHLKSDDFFGVENFPTASLVLTKVAPSGTNAYNVTGELTIKGITHPVNFSMLVYNQKATASLKIDRTLYNVRYGSASFFDDLKNKAIDNEFDLTANLEF